MQGIKVILCAAVATVFAAVVYLTAQQIDKGPNFTEVNDLPALEDRVKQTLFIFNPPKVEELLDRLTDPEAFAGERRIIGAFTELAEVKQARERFKDEETLRQDEAARFSILHPVEFKALVDQNRDAETKQQEALEIELILFSAQFRGSTAHDSVGQP